MEESSAWNETQLVPHKNVYQENEKQQQKQQQQTKIKTNGMCNQKPCGITTIWSKDRKEEKKYGK